MSKNLWTKEYDGDITLAALTHDFACLAEEILQPEKDPPLVETPTT
jgi:hypothetical protein